MEFVNKNPKIFVLSGKAKSGKNLLADMIEKYYKDNNCIQISYAYYLKQYIKKITNWDGKEETKPRKLLQELGIELIKNRIDSNLLIRRILEDIKVYSYFYDVIIITDARLIDEIETIQSHFKNVVTIRINRQENNNKMSSEENNHITEIALDEYDKFDYIIDDVNEIYNILKEG